LKKHTIVASKTLLKHTKDKGDRDKMPTKLTDMKRGETGVIRNIDGGIEAARRIKNIGLRLGKKVKKIEGHPQKGPQTVLIDNFKIAIGFGMADKIYIELEK